MTPVREAIVLPLLFLTVVFAAAIRPGGAVSVVPPALGSLVAGVAVLALLVRSGALAPERLMNGGRSPLANLNGLSVLMAVFAASAELVTALVPESGVPALVAWIVLVTLLVQAFAMGPDRTRLLRGLVVIFGAAFVLKFIVLASLSAPAEGPVGRAVQMRSGFTLGMVTARRIHSRLSGVRGDGAVSDRDRPAAGSAGATRSSTRRQDRRSWHGARASRRQRGDASEGDGDRSERGGIEGATPNSKLKKRVAPAAVSVPRAIPRRAKRSPLRTPS